MLDEVMFDTDKDDCAYKILLVEDSIDDQCIMKRQITDLWPSADIVLVDCLRDAYNIFKTQKFDLVILDLNLPDAFGPNTVGEMRKFNRATPIVVLTGVLTSITVDEALKLGANNVCSKSQIGESDFLDILKQNIG